ncbi:hypothetical protein [Shinella sp.]|jgi:hypothetical protein|uniref:hypothetical protein n=1 Tax=Shinella sp. TaxID=1870904 RepID=UPI003F6FCF6E
MTVSDNLSAIEKAPNRIQGMVRSVDQYRNGDPKAIADGSYAQVLYALTDYKHDVIVLWEFAVSEARKAEALQQEVVDLRDSLSDVLELAERQWANPEELSEIRRARTLLNGGSDAQE